MVKNRQTSARGSIPEIGFRRDAGHESGVEVLSLAEFRRRVDAPHRAQARRPAFHHVVSIASGSTTHMVDFDEHRLVPGRWLWVRPHQVHRWGGLDRVEGTLVLFEPDALDAATSRLALLDDVFCPPVRRVERRERSSLDDTVALLADATRARAAATTPTDVAVVRHLLAALVLRLAQAPTDAEPAPASDRRTFVEFRAAVEEDYTRTRQVDDYGRRLGWSSRTLSRATMAAAGVNAKEFIDRRVTLEAKRSLAHSDLTAAQIASALGFDSASNFGKFFRHREGMTPIAFRAAQRGR